MAKKLMMMVAAVAVAFGAWADTETVGRYTWTYQINGGTAEIYKGYSYPAISPSPSGAVTLPRTLGGRPVTSIGNSAFYGCSGLTSVTIPDSVTSIGYEAFENCSGLTSVTIPASVTSIGERAFYNCSDSLFDTTTIPGVKLVDGWAVGKTGVLSGNLSLTGIRGIGPSAFSGCSGLTSVTIPEGVTSIGNYAFRGCSGLTSVTIPDGVTSIGEQAFSGCSDSLFDTTTIPGVKLVDGWAVGNTGVLSGKLSLTGIRGIGPSAFSGCSGLTSVTIPEGVTSIGYGAFSFCSGLTSVTIPASVTTIGERAFYYCSGLTKVTMLDGVTIIGNSAFLNCGNLMEVIIPDSVIRVDASVFNGCGRLKNITLPTCVCNSTLASEFPTLYRSFTNVTVATGVSLVGNSLFAGCSGLESVTIPSSVTRLGDSIFKDCSALQSVKYEGDAPDVGINIYEGTPRSLVTYVNGGSIGWAGGISDELPTDWNGRGIAHVESGGSSGGGSSGGVGPQTNADARYDLSNSQKDRSIASVTVDGDCAIDEFVLIDGKVYDSVLFLSNTADRAVTLTLPSGYSYKTYKGTKPLQIPAKSQCMLSITRVADRTFLVSREELEDVQ